MGWRSGGEAATLSGMPLIINGTDTAQHFHIAARTVPGAWWTLPQGGHVTQFTEWCACGAHREAPHYTNAGGFTTFGAGTWSGGQPGL